MKKKSLTTRIGRRRFAESIFEHGCRSFAEVGGLAAGSGCWQSWVLGHVYQGNFLGHIHRVSTTITTAAENNKLDYFWSCLFFMLLRKAECYKGSRVICRM